MSCKAVLNEQPIGHTSQICKKDVYTNMQPQLMVMHAELPQALWHCDLQEASQHSRLRNDRFTSNS